MLLTKRLSIKEYSIEEVEKVKLIKTQKFNGIIESIKEVEEDFEMEKDRHN